MKARMAVRPSLTKTIDTSPSLTQTRGTGAPTANPRPPATAHADSTAATATANTAVARAHSALVEDGTSVSGLLLTWALLGLRPAGPPCSHRHNPPLARPLQGTCCFISTVCRCHLVGCAGGTPTVCTAYLDVVRLADKLLSTGTLDGVRGARGSFASLYSLGALIWLVYYASAPARLTSVAPFAQPARYPALPLSPFVVACSRHYCLSL